MAQEKDKISDFFCLIKELFFTGKFFRTHELSEKGQRTLHNIISIMLMVAAYQWGIWVYFYVSFQKFTPVVIPHVPVSQIDSTNTAGAFLISQFSGAFSFTVQTIENWMGLLDFAWRIVGLTEFSIGIFVFLSLFTGEWLPNRRKYFMIIAAACGVLNNGWLMAGDNLPNWSLFANTNGNNMDTDVIYFGLAILILIMVVSMDYFVKKRKESANKLKV